MIKKEYDEIFELYSEAIERIVIKYKIEYENEKCYIAEKR